jgi:hypothetical protein
VGEQEGIVVVEVMLLDIHCGKVEFGEQLKVESESRKGEGFGLKLFEEVVSDRSFLVLSGCNVKGFDDEHGGRIKLKASLELFPELVIALIGQEVFSPGGVEEGQGLFAKPCDDVVIIHRAGATFVFIGGANALQTENFMAFEIAHQAVVVQMHF